MKGRKRIVAFRTSPHLHQVSCEPMIEPLQGLTLPARTYDGVVNPSRRLLVSCTYRGFVAHSKATKGRQAVAPSLLSLTKAERSIASDNLNSPGHASLGPSTPDAPGMGFAIDLVHLEPDFQHNEQAYHVPRIRPEGLPGPPHRHQLPDGRRGVPLPAGLQRPMGISFGFHVVSWAGTEDTEDHCGYRVEARHSRSSTRF